MLEIEFYGVLRELVAPRASLEVPPGATVRQVLERLAQAYPQLQGHLPRVACAQGESLLARDRPVDPGQPLVLLPPVSGG